MTRWGGIALALLATAAALALYVRLAPSDPARWHVAPPAPQGVETRNAALRTVPAGPETLARLDAIIRAEPRTRVLAGSVAEGMVSYVTRSALFGFPDYTTLRQAGGDVQLYGRARFGLSDMGVNARRLERWLARLGQDGGEG